jgi:hypothetical protein
MNNVLIWVNNFLNRVLLFFGLRQMQNYWGIVYDSVSKQPLDPAVVKLIDAKTGKVISTCITNLKGRYGFLTAPGKYKILVKKTNYTFPSKIVSGDKDQNFSNIYHGELFTLEGESEVLPFNIPMDPAAFDWNQQAKLNLNKVSPFLDFFVTSLVRVVFWFLFLLSLFSFYFSRWIVSGLFIIFYILLFLLAVLLPHVRLWGKLKCYDDNAPIGFALLELSYIKAEDIVVSRAHTMPDGKFFLYAEPGNYLLKVKKLDQLGQMKLLKTKKITIGPHGVYNYFISC